ncbi:MAG: hypothetical protein ACLRZ9_06015 [Eubacterium sp.]
MSYQSIAKAKAIERKNKELLLKVNPNLNDMGGIYFLLRQDEDGFKYAYIGQSKESAGILTRLAQHMVGYKQHIDLSIRKHGLYGEDNPYGWKVEFLNFPDSELDEKEQYYIKKYALNGYQLRNVSLGGQGEGRNMINETKPAKGYRDGLAQGRKSLAKELKHIIDTHLTVSIRQDKQNNKVSIKAFEKFNNLLEEENGRAD